MRKEGSSIIGLTREVINQQDLSMTGRGMGAIAFPHNFICWVRVVETPGTTEIAFSRMGALWEEGAGTAEQG